ncbi:TetR/AcrR family transcriptional regulator [Croceitalea sp. MTPC5]|uniref:TetR/AcrR family transcriptional regulator n=1 Tax=Croceitalea sp. MTPC5 TaxID=3056565 RepID=UPI002B3F8042|nr:TetR/AcrR family transcriptional regulator [Croceitalea sp. MTPC5]
MPRTKQFDEKEVLKKAMELFWEKGFHATSIQDLVSGLGINRASLYDTFGGKDALFLKAFALYRENSTQVIKTLFEGEPSVRTAFVKLFDFAIEEAIQDETRKGCFVVNVTTELIPGNHDLVQVLLKNKENVEGLFASMVKRGLDSGELKTPKDPDTLGAYLFALYSGLRVVAKVDPNADRLRQIVTSGLSILS